MKIRSNSELDSASNSSRPADRASLRGSAERTAALRRRAVGLLRPAADRGPEGAGPLRCEGLSRWPRHITLSETRSRLYQHRSLQVNSHFSAFFEIYKICIILYRSEIKFLEKIIQHFQKFVKLLQKIENLQNFMKHSSTSRKP